MQLCHKFGTIFDYCEREYVKMYIRFIEELKLYSKVIRVLSKGYLPISLLPQSKFGENSKRSEDSNCKIQQRL